MNRLFFRSRVKAGISSLLGIALGESAKSYLANDPSKLVDPIVGFVRNLLDNTKEKRTAKKQRRSFENRYDNLRSEEHTSELQSLMRISYSVIRLITIKLKQTINYTIPRIML